MRKILSIIFICCMFSFALHAQVTIGSNIEANKGALLDLKEYSGTENSTRGLVLPRVKLTALDNLDDVGVSGAAELVSHIGLTVYNVGSSDVCEAAYQSGVYIWNGQRWTLMGKEELSQATTGLTGINQPNSYMMAGRGTIIIPTAKAFAVWDGVSWLDDSGVSVLPARTFTGISPMQAQVIWMDAQNVVTSVSTSSSTEDSSGTITVKTEKCGNAIVALLVDDKIIWSWHIWVTPPVDEVVFNGKTWMDRNIGAISSSLNNSLSKGLYYQWGRKDPFPYKTTDWGTTGEPTLYKPDGANPTINKSVSVGTNNQNNASASVSEPSSFIKSSAFPYDWYSQNLSKWNTRWGANGAKSVSDPCPEGWRVPDGTTSPWTGLTVGSSSNFTQNKGWNWSNAGFYPATGCRVDANGEINGVSVNGYYWSSQPNISLAKGLYFNSTAMDTWASGYRGSGFSVRCVKE